MMGMSKFQFLFRMTLGGCVMGFLPGIVLGGVSGLLLGLRIGNISLGLDGALIGGVLSGMGGGICCLVIGWRDCTETPHNAWISPDVSAPPTFQLRDPETLERTRKEVNLALRDSTTVAPFG